MKPLALVCFVAALSAHARIAGAQHRSDTITSVCQPYGAYDGKPVTICADVTKETWTSPPKKAFSIVVRSTTFPMHKRFFRLSCSNGTTRDRNWIVCPERGISVQICSPGLFSSSCISRRAVFE
jgi:hypothetical protein